MKVKRPTPAQRRVLSEVLDGWQFYYSQYTAPWGEQRTHYGLAREYSAVQHVHLSTGQALLASDWFTWTQGGDGNYYAELTDAGRQAAKGGM